jgi:SAM-dependent methyltransferase
MAVFERREELRSTFGRSAEVYDSARPPYPDAVFEDLIRAAQVAPPASLLEIGCGSGIATRVLAAIGFEIVAIELSGDMAAQAKQNLERFPEVKIVRASFEDYERRELFDGVVAFSAFHWLSPDARCRKASSLLRPQGFLAVVDARLMPEDERFVQGLASDCEAVLGSAADKPGAPGLTPLRDEMEANRFSHVLERRYTWTRSYTADGFVALLGTLPWYLSIAESPGAALAERIRDRIESHDNGEVAVRFDAILDLGLARP